MIVSVKHISKKEVEYNLDKEIVILGRSGSCDITIESDNISRTHLEIKIEEQKLLIRDASSKNWVSYDGEQLSKEVFVQYFDFMPLILPDSYTITIKNPVLVENDPKTISRTDIMNRPRKRSTKIMGNPKKEEELSDEQLSSELIMEEKKISKKKSRQKEFKKKIAEVEPTENLDSKKQSIFILIVAITVAIAYAAYRDLI